MLDVMKPAPCRLDNCTGHPPLPEGWTSWQEALHSDLDNDRDGQAFTVWLLEEPTKRAATLGHSPTWDPSASGVSRWTCTRCDRAVLLYGSNIYGSATEVRCTETEG